MAPAAISRRVNAERIVLVGWLRALLLQLAHPLIAAGVAEHSSFGGSTVAALSRLSQTVDAMLAITFGTPAERAQSLDDIRVVHRRVHGRLSEPCGVFPAGTRYSAEDSELLVWVHATLAESILLAYAQLVEPIAPEDLDRYCADSAQVAVELGADPDAVPRSWRAVRQYVDHGCRSGRVAVGPQARTMAQALLSPLRHSLGRVVIAPCITLLAAGQLPECIRRQYGLRWDTRRARRFARAMAALRALRRLAPARAALWTMARSRPCLRVRHGYSAAAR